MAKREDYFEITPPVDEKEVQNPFDGKNSEQKKEEAREEKSEGAVTNGEESDSGQLLLPGTEQ